MERASSISRLSLSTNMQMQPPKSSNFSLNSSHSNEDEGTREERGSLFLFLFGSFIESDLIRLRWSLILFLFLNIAFRFWMNSIGILVKNLFEDLKDGLALLRV